ncbi:hypothetical protein [Amycolatopsis viridis]|uniref:Uncharacterized protein n=1 Tax=Amycolatopsis viridis TaxID=185678 RepID=A0ABX0T2K3_9PSEU|nr:hypothetical protein [Amycolatopsis viridis]NIH82120.1 hypothetical protein [Amycolatopsis viridis]
MSGPPPRTWGGTWTPPATHPSSFIEGMRSKVHEIARMWTAERVLDQHAAGLVGLSPDVRRQLQQAAGRVPAANGRPRPGDPSVLSDALAQGLNRWVDAAVDRRANRPGRATGKNPDWDFVLAGRIHGNGSSVDLTRYAGRDLRFTSSARDQAEGTAQAYRDLIGRENGVQVRPETDARFSFGLTRNLKSDPTGAEKDYFDPKHPDKKRYYDGQWIHDKQRQSSRFSPELKREYQREAVFFGNDEPVLSPERFNQKPEAAIEAMRRGPGQALTPGGAALAQVRKDDVHGQLGWLASDGHDHLHVQFAHQQRSNLNFAVSRSGTTALAQHAAGLQTSILRAAAQAYRPPPPSPMAQHAAGLQTSILRAAAQAYRPPPPSPMAQHAAGLQTSILRAAAQAYRPPPQVYRPPSTMSRYASGLQASILRAATQAYRPHA